MMNRLLHTGASLAALMICMSPEGTGSASDPAKPSETPKPVIPDPKTEAPRVAQTQAPTAPAAKTTTAPATGKTAPAAGKTAPVNGKSAAGKTAPVKGKADAKKAEQPKRRESKIAPIQEKLVALLKKGSMTVQALAAKLDCTELQVRQAIDRARAGQGPEKNINRIARNTFGYEKPKRS